MNIAEIARNHNAQFWALQIAGWTGWTVLFTVRSFQLTHSFESMELIVVDALLGLILTTALRYIYRAVWERPIATRVAVVLVASYIMAAIWQPAKNYAQFAYMNDFSWVEKEGYMALFSGLLGYSYFLMVGWSGLYFGLKFYNLLQLETERSIRAESMAHEAQLRMLRYQLNPHFLFNTLNAISTLILEKNTDAANKMVTKLAGFLRYSLDKDLMQKVSLDHEINTLRLYFDIEQERFGDRLDVQIDLPEETRGAMVPSLLLQPLVENSIKYAVANCETGGQIRIAARRSGDDLLLDVSDNGPGIELDEGEVPAFDGIGIANIRERLAALYGERHDCRFRRGEPQGLSVEIRIPFEGA